MYKDKCESETNGGKTWSRGTNSLLPFVAKVTLNLARARGLLRPVVQTLDSFIHRNNQYPVDNYYGNQLHYPLDRDLGSDV